MIKKMKILHYICIVVFVNVFFLSCVNNKKNRSRLENEEVYKPKVALKVKRTNSVHLGVYNHFNLFNLTFSDSISNHGKSYYKVVLSNDSLICANGVIDTIKFEDSILLYNDRFYLTTSGFSLQSQKKYKSIFVFDNLCLMRYWVLIDNGNYFITAVDSMPNNSYFTRRYLNRASATVCKTIFDCFNKIDVHEYSVSYEGLDSFSIDLNKDNYLIHLTQTVIGVKDPINIPSKKTKCKNCDFYMAIRKEEIVYPYFPTIPL